jgi:4-carboxymuconolactone decarboxylase
VTVLHGRLTWPRPDELDAPAREVYDAIAGGPRARGVRLFRMTDDEGRLEGPFNSMLVAPSVGLPLQELGAAIRYRSGLTDRVREIAILAVAVHHHCEYEWYAHEAVGRACGMTDEEFDAIRAGVPAPSFDRAEQAAFAACRSLLTKRSLTDDEATEFTAALGSTAITELTVLIGYYQTLQLLIGAWAAPLPAGVAPVFAQASGEDPGR